MVTTTLPVGAFSAIEARDAFEVNVSIGPTSQVVLHVNENLLGKVDVSVANGTLRIGLKPGVDVQQASLAATVTATTLSGIDASGAAHVHLHGTLGNQSLRVALSGASGFDGNLSGGSVTADLSGSSQLILAGSVQQLSVTASGSSQINAGQLKPDGLTVDLSGGSLATVGVTEEIAATLSGASTLVYQGTPRFTRKTVSGDSTLEQA
jgi:hypothetical protein